MFSPGQNVTVNFSGEFNAGQVWGFKEITGQYVVNVPALNRCLVVNPSNLTVR